MIGIHAYVTHYAYCYIICGMCSQQHAVLATVERRSPSSRRDNDLSFKPLRVQGLLLRDDFADCLQCGNVRSFGMVIIQSAERKPDSHREGASSREQRVPFYSTFFIHKCMRQIALLLLRNSPNIFPRSTTWCDRTNGVPNASHNNDPPRTGTYRCILIH